MIHMHWLIYAHRQQTCSYIKVASLHMTIFFSQKWVSMISLFSQMETTIFMMRERLCLKLHDSLPVTQFLAQTIHGRTIRKRKHMYGAPSKVVKPIMECSQRRWVHDPPNLHPLFILQSMIGKSKPKRHLITKHAMSPGAPFIISNHMPSRVWDEITYSFLNFNGCTVEV